MNVRDRRVVITGLGVVTSLGYDVDRLFDALCHGVSGIRPIRRFDVSSCPSKLGGIIEDFDPTSIVQDRAGRRMLRLADWIQALGICAADLACRDARLGENTVASERLGVFFGAGRGGTRAMEAMARGLFEVFLEAPPNLNADPERAEAIYREAVTSVFSHERPAGFLQQCPCLIATYVAMRYGARGPALTNVNLCSAGAQAIGEAAWVISRGDADVMIAGGADSMLNAAELRAFCELDAVSRRNEDGPEACKPFDLRRDGCVVSEGATVVVLEALDHAKRRGVRAHAELLGYGSSCDAFKVTAPPEDGAGAVLAMRRALEHAGLGPSDVNHVNAHGTGTPLNDRIETLAIRTVLGAHAYQVPVVSTKSMTGHLIAAAGALEVAITAKCLEERRIPPTINLRVRDPHCDLDYVAEGQRKLSRPGVALTNSFAIGGTNSCLVLGEAPASR